MELVHLGRLMAAGASKVYIHPIAESDLRKWSWLTLCRHKKDDNMLQLPANITKLSMHTTAFAYAMREVH